jgi:hypothetical protein
MRRSLGVATVVVALLAGATWAGLARADQPEPTNPLAKAHPIEIDARGIVPPTVWGVPGITEPIQSLSAPMTDKVVTLKLRPGRYSYMTTVFSFEFTVSLDGKVGYASSLDQCVGGRGTATLIVKCRRTQPF